MPTPDDILNEALRSHQRGDLIEAERLYRRVLAADPRHAQALHLLGGLAHQTGQHAAAVALIRQAIALNPGASLFHYNLGLVYRKQAQFAEAATCLREATRLNPNHVEAYTYLAEVLTDPTQAAEAIACYRQALRLNPTLATAHNNLGVALLKKGELTEAAVCFLNALRLNPNYAEAHNNMGNLLKDQGRVQEALGCFRNAIQVAPRDQARYDNLLLSLHYASGYDAPSLFEEHRRWQVEHAQLPVPSRYDNDRAPERRLRIGYVSPDFRVHVVGRNVWPLIREHDHSQFDITLYANLPRTDTMSEHFRGCADQWCSIAGWPDERVADRVRQDGIDLLVDLALHTDGNSLLAFARKPAPVQVTFAGYPGSTGLRPIDYRLTDPYLDPPGLFDAWYSEKSYRLPHSFWCYYAPSEEPPVGPLPALARGHITFGCLNNFCKINDEVLRLWARVLRGTPGSRLLMLAHEGSHRQKTRDLLAGEGVVPERVQFHVPRPRPEYLALYHQIDIGLDTLPYNGHSTSLDSYWMGVPVVTLVGQTVVGRGGLSQLTNLGLSELAANTADDFVRTAHELAGDLPRLEILRGSLRQRMKQSPLMDAVGFTRGIEAAYRDMWRAWCGQR